MTANLLFTAIVGGVSEGWYSALAADAMVSGGCVCFISVQYSRRAEVKRGGCGFRAQLSRLEECLVSG